MPITPINVTTKQHLSGLEKLALGLDIINKTLGTALEIPKYLQQKKLIESQQTTEGLQRTKLGAETKHIEAQTEDLKQPKNDLSDFDKATFNAYSSDYTPVPQQSQKSITLKLGGRDTFWEPKANIEGQDKLFTREQGLRKEFLNQSSGFVQQAEGYGRVLSGAKAKSGAGDVSIVYGYIKLLDPNSAVREGEIALANEAKNVPDRVLSVYNKALKGELMAPEQRQNFINSAKGLFENARQFQQQREKTYTSIAKENDINPTRVVSNLGDNIISSIEKSISGIEHLSDEDLLNTIHKKKNR
jgi:hypothetical protein